MAANNRRRRRLASICWIDGLFSFFSLFLPFFFLCSVSFDFFFFFLFFHFHEAEQIGNCVLQRSIVGECEREREPATPWFAVEPEGRVRRRRRRRRRNHKKRKKKEKNEAHFDNGITSIARSPPPPPPPLLAQLLRYKVLEEVEGVGPVYLMVTEERGPRAAPEYVRRVQNPARGPS